MKIKTIDPAFEKMADSWQFPIGVYFGDSR